MEDQETSDTKQECNEEQSSFKNEEGSEKKSGDEGSAPTEHEAQVNPLGLFIYEENKHKWGLKAPEARDQPSNIVIQSGPKNDTVNDPTPLMTWSLLFTDAMIDIIVQHTNEEIERYLGSRKNKNFYKKNKPMFAKTTFTEIKALIGLLYFAGLKKCSHEYPPELWTKSDHPIFKKTMSAKRFKYLMPRLRFDDEKTQLGTAHDMVAPIRDLWEKFIQNCRTYYTPSEEVTIDEELFEYQGIFEAKVMGKRKQRKGIRIFCLNDAKTYYLYNAVLPTEKNELADGIIPSHYVRALCQPIYGSKRNVTCNNWYLSGEIIDEMLEEYSLTMVGKINAYDPRIPETFHRTEEGIVFYACDTTKMLLFYYPEPNKPVLMFSSLHKMEETEKSGEPEIMEYYNRTKGGTDSFSKLCSLHSCWRRTEQWFIRFFMGMLDQAAVNSYILYNMSRVKNQSEFLEELSLDLVTPFWLKETVQQPKLTQKLKRNISEVTGESSTAVDETKQAKM